MNSNKEIYIVLKFVVVCFFIIIIITI